MQIFIDAGRQGSAAAVPQNALAQPIFLSVLIAAAGIPAALILPMNADMACILRLRG